MKSTSFNNSRNKRINMRLTEAEYRQMMQAFNASSDRKLSSYVRKLLLGKPVKVLIRDRSLDEFMETLVALKKELNALGNNFNQVVKRIHSVHDTELKFWLGFARRQQEQLLQQIEILNSSIVKFSKQWFQNS